MKKVFTPIHLETYPHETKGYVTKWESYASGGGVCYGNTPEEAEHRALQQAKQYFRIGAQTRTRRLLGKALNDNSPILKAISGGFLPPV